MSEYCDLTLEKYRKLDTIYLGRKCIIKMAFPEYAKEIVKRWNSHDALTEELADYKEGTEGLKLTVGDLRDQRDALLKACEYNQLLLSEENIGQRTHALALIEAALKLAKKS